MPEKVINIDGLSQAAKTYDPMLKTLPFLTLDPALTKLGINLLQVGDGENIEITQQRRGGILKPMSLTADDELDGDEKEMIRFVEMGLTPKKAYAALKDNIENYTSEKKVLNNVTAVNQQTKQHPFEAQIVMAKVTTVAEDLLDALFHSKRDESDLSPMGITDGFYTLQDNFIAAGAITEGKKNLIAAGSFDAPTAEDNWVAYTSLVAWLRSLDPMLRKSQFALYVPGGVLLNVMDAMGNKFRYLNDVNMNAVETILREKALCPGLSIKTDACLGTGTRIFATALGSLDYGMTGLGDKDFVQIRTPYKNPNWFQTWMQFEVGQRIKSLHPKMFAMSDGTTESLSLSGDYIS